MVLKSDRRPCPVSRGPRLPMQRVAEGGSEDAGRHGYQTDAGDGGKTGQDLTDDGVGNGVAVADRGERSDRPPHSPRYAAERIRLCFALDDIEQRRGHEQQHAGDGHAHGEFVAPRPDRVGDRVERAGIAAELGEHYNAKQPEEPEHRALCPGQRQEQAGEPGKVSMYRSRPRSVGP